MALEVAQACRKGGLPWVSRREREAQAAKTYGDDGADLEQLLANGPGLCRLHRGAFEPDPTQIVHQHVKARLESQSRSWFARNVCELVLSEKSPICCSFIRFSMLPRAQ